MLLTGMVAAFGVLSPALADATAAADWKNDWGVDDDFTIEVDSTGYSLPSAIVFVPNPGSDPGDPLYFVTELRGKVKVVTNDRTVHVFAEDFFDLTPKEELPSGYGQTGLAGVCLDPANGYVFVTFTYQDEAGVLRNNMARFQSTPGSFSLQPESFTVFTDVFSAHESGLAHQIGPCQVMGNTVLVSIGEAWRPLLARDIDAMYGKLIRMTLDGKPVVDNPFYVDDDIKKVRNYVWAYGLRNTFSLKALGERVFVAENGLNVDRFMEVEEGMDYLWEGNDHSVATNAAYVFSPSLGPVQMDYLGDDGADGFPAGYREQFFVGLSAFEPHRGKNSGVLRIPYSLQQDRVTAVPDFFVQYRGDEYQMVAGVAVGPDGLYFSPLLPVANHPDAVLKVRYEPGVTSSARGELIKALPLMIEKGCVGCHIINDNWGFGGSEGPALNASTLGAILLERLHSEAYVASVHDIHDLQQSPLPEYRAAREEVLAAEGMDRVRIWMKHRIMEPRFDNVYSQMPNQRLTEAEALAIVDYFIKETTPQDVSFLSRVKGKLKQIIPENPGRRDLVFTLVAGFALGLFFVVLVGWMLRGKCCRKGRG